MSLAEVAAWIRSTFRHADGTLDEEFESIVEHLKADPDFTLSSRIEALLADADAHININGTEFTLTSRLRALPTEGRT